MIERTVRRTIEEHRLIQKGDYVVIGLSGGPDSVCLFSILRSLGAELDLRIRAVHVNHMMRPGPADEDQRYVEAFCQRAGVRCDVEAIDCVKIAKEQGITGEEAGRNARYEAFYRAAKNLIEESGAPAEKIKIAVAQNKNDQAETVLMRILRGTGVDGLSGIEYARGGELGTTVIRPLLDVGREAVLEYCEKNGLNPRMDHTNDLPIYTRNKVRLDLIPHIAENFNENIIETLSRLARVSREDKAYLWKQAQTAFKELREPGDTGSGQTRWGYTKYSRAVLLDRAGLRDLDAAIRHRVIMMAFDEIGLKRDIAAAHLEGADRILESQKASASSDFPQGYAMAVSYGKAMACRLSEGGTAPFSENMVLTQKILDITEIREECGQMPEGNAVFLDFERVFEKLQGQGEGISLRNRRPGDVFTPEGMKSGRKKIQDYFIDSKIPKGVRDQYLLACIGGEALWVIGPSLERGVVNENYKLRPGTKRVLRLEISEKL